MVCACRETTSLKLAKLRGVTFVNQYVVIKYLGKGANGRVFLCLDMCDNRLYAVKVTSLLKRVTENICIMVLEGDIESATAKSISRDFYGSKRYADVWP